MNDKITLGTVLSGESFTCDTVGVLMLVIGLIVGVFLGAVSVDRGKP